MSNKEFNAMVGTFLKVSISSVLSMVIAKGGIWGVDWKELISAAAISGAMVLYNYFNPSDPRYGLKKHDQLPPNENKA